MRLLRWRPLTRPSSGSQIPPTVGHGDVVTADEPVARPRLRPDIDGLRAVAVLPVILFHAGTPYFSGGYVGVDVFFVISGYLITAILYREMANDHFSLVTFYERRVRRIIPALVVLMFAVLVVTWFMFLPKDLADTGQSLIATSTFLSNFLFYIKTTYFGTAAENKVLIHTWSLAVEEQFYIFFPILLYAIVRFAKRFVVQIVALLTFLSFALSAWSIHYYPVETFYFPFTRVWELGLGSILAIALQRRMIAEASSNLFAAFGLILILASIVLLTPETRFPGPAALPVCLGTAFLLYAGSGGASTFVGRILEMRFFVFTGLISYSLYLWHWPALAVATYYDLKPPEGLPLLLLLAGVYIAAALSWRFVETPVRVGKVFRSRAHLFAAATVSLVGLTAAGAALVITEGAPGRLPPEVVRLSKARFAEHRIGCPPAPGAKYGGICRIGEVPPRFAVWGDSHVGALRPAFGAAAEAAGSSGLAFTANGCPALVGMDHKRLVREQNDCRAYNRESLRLIRQSGVQTVFLAANWLEYAEPGRFKDGTLAQGLAQTIEALRGIDVVLVTRVPGGRQEVAAGLARELLFQKPGRIEYSRAEVERMQRPLNQLFGELQRKYGVTLFRSDGPLCGQVMCPVEIDGEPLYSDAHHLTPAATPLLAPHLEPLIPR